jgi:hypothetical protein
VSYNGTALGSRFSKLGSCSVSLFSVFRGIWSTTCGFLNSHFPPKQLFTVDLRDCLFDIAEVLKCNKGVALTASKSLRQADIGTFPSISVTSKEMKRAYIFIPAKASLKSCSELLYARLPTHTRLVFPAEGSG